VSVLTPSSSRAYLTSPVFGHLHSGRVASAALTSPGVTADREAAPVELEPTDEWADASVRPDHGYLLDETVHEQVEVAIDDVLASIGLEIKLRADAVRGQCRLAYFRQATALIFPLVRAGLASFMVAGASCRVPCWPGFLTG
jgi:hypothetical protein